MKTKALLATFFLLPLLSFGWGAEGHKMVATIAQKNLNTGVEAKVKQYLGTMTFQSAATWMDDIRDDHSLDYMKPWHFVNIDSGQTYEKNPKGDIVHILDSIITELKEYKTMKQADVARDLKILFHLCGDITQPLHVGYGKDKGGNSVDVFYLKNKSNLHKVWDSEIIKTKKITATVCLKTASTWSADKKKKIQTIDPMAWMTDSRTYLDKAYEFQNGVITQAYINANAVIIQEQIAKGGLRLAAVLNDVFRE